MNKDEELTYWKNEAIKQRADFLMLSEYIRKIGVQPVFWANGEDWLKVAEREYESELGKRRDYEEEIEKLKKPPIIEYVYSSKDNLDWSIRVIVNGIEYPKNQEWKVCDEKCCKNNEFLFF
jgi:hypothetical protein